MRRERCVVMEARTDELAVPETAPGSVGGSAGRARASLERQLRAEAERLEQEVESFYRATEERASALAEEKVSDAATRVGAELRRRLAAEVDELRRELSGEVAGAIERLDDRGSRLLESARETLEAATHARLADQDPEARAGFEALERTISERVALAEATVRERVERTVAEARRAVAGEIESRLSDEVRRLRDALAAWQVDAAKRGESQAEAAHAEAREIAGKFRAEIKEHLKASLGSAEERLRGEVASGLLAAREELAGGFDRRVSELMDGLGDTLRADLRAEVARASGAARSDLAEDLGERIDRWAVEVRERAEAAEKRLEEKVEGRLATGSEALRKRLEDGLDELGRDVTARRAELGAELDALREQIGYDIRERAVAEVETAATRAREGLADYVENALSPKARRLELRLAREDREKRIAAAEARVESYGAEILRTIRVDADRARAETAAELRLEVGEHLAKLEGALTEVEATAERVLDGAFSRVSEVFDAEADALRLGLEGEVARLTGLARAELGAEAASAVLDVERGARQRIEATARRVSDELETARLRARTETDAAVGDAIGTIRATATDVLRVRRLSRHSEPT